MPASCDMWPVHPRGRRHELFSSWLARTGHRHGLAGRTFCRLAWREASTTRADLDREIAAGTLDALTQVTGWPADVFTRMTLASLHGAVFTDVWASPWILSQGPTGRRFGQQVCPDCLLEEDPHWPIWWRLAFVSCCSRHGRILIDRCKACGSQLSALQVRARHHPLRHCHRCAAPLWRATREACEAGAERLQRLCVAVAETGFYEQCHGHRLPAVAFFETLYLILLRVRRDGAAGVLAPVRDMDERERIRLRFNGHFSRLSQLPPVARHRLFALAADVLDANSAASHRLGPRRRFSNVEREAP
jgi:TniQ